MNRSGRLVASAIVSLSLLASSTAAVASATPAQSQVDPWLALSVMSGTASSAALADVVPPPPPPAGPYNAGPPYGAQGTTPPWPVLAILLAVLATDIYVLSRHHSHIHIPNSPA